MPIPSAPILVSAVVASAGGPDYLPNGIFATWTWPSVAVVIDQPAAGVYTKDAALHLSGHITNSTSISSATYTIKDSAGHTLESGSCDVLSTFFSKDLRLYAVGDGSNVITVTCITPDGTSNSSVTTVFDDIAPIGVLRFNKAAITGSASVSLQAVCSDNTLLESVVFSTVNDTGIAAAGYSKTITQALALGLNTFTLTVTDKAGNVFTSTASITRVDMPSKYDTLRNTDPPTIKVLPDVVTLSTNPVTIRGVASGVAAITSVTWRNVNHASEFGDCTGTNNWTANVMMEFGANTFDFVATDANGNYAVQRVTFNSTAAFLKVLIVLPADETLFGTDQATIDVSGTFDAGAAIADAGYALNGGARQTLASLDSWAISSLGLSAGENTLVVDATDSNGVTASRTFTIYRDTDTPSDALLQTILKRNGKGWLQGTASDATKVKSVTYINSATGNTGTARLF